MLFYVEPYREFGKHMMCKIKYHEKLHKTGAKIMVTFCWAYNGSVYTGRNSDPARAPPPIDCLGCHGSEFLPV